MNAEEIAQTCYETVRTFESKCNISQDESWDYISRAAREEHILNVERIAARDLQQSNDLPLTNQASRDIFFVVAFNLVKENLLLKELPDVDS